MAEQVASDVQDSMYKADGSIDQGLERTVLRKVDRQHADTADGHAALLIAAPRDWRMLRLTTTRAQDQPYPIVCVSHSTFAHRVLGRVWPESAALSCKK